ncbi:MAG TPA: DUF2783 domain-containing protein [Rhodospirillales bacterium]|nr:DUF2783 domain-containing protein [Rhodospirillales bacterium]
MEQLAKDLRLERVDEIYAELIEAHRGLDAEQSLRFDARLILLLINQIGDERIVREAIRAAREAETPS